jgi:hypothetical protein
MDVPIAARWSQLRGTFKFRLYAAALCTSCGERTTNLKDSPPAYCSQS